ncbi:putative NIF3 family GTP cyclohydrolase 1 type 2 [Cecembia rubra]|uniref:Putative NIF3 family GTP cyclohydrolase 1 type 2 n=2 Tax=Cecembia rubra TaxID=1485585 RepID=A0A2P8E1E9_9BACT|nr:putative NIF3 family GTP cyclohydrolase 1 type 2 [Cecembia rubra]
MGQYQKMDENLARRKFLIQTAVIMGAVTAPVFPTLASIRLENKDLTIKEVIEILIKDIPGAPFERTVDQLRSGNMDQKVTGIVTTMFPTLDVIEQTAKIGANLIVAHETLYYNHQDDTDWLEEDEVFQLKKALIEKNQIAIWRFHDYWHRRRPDGIAEGNLKKLGWEKYYNPESPRLLNLPQPQPLRDILAHIKQQFEIPQVRLVGDLDQVCKSIYLAFGAIDSRMIIAAIQEYQPDLILSGETREWETVERVRDGRLLGKNTALMILGHELSEARGMEFAAEWIQEKIPNIKVSYIASGNPFQFV